MKIDDNIMRMHQVFLDAAQFTFEIIMEREHADKMRCRFLADDLRRTTDELQKIIDFMP